jgi:hypothetical protein
MSVAVRIQTTMVKGLIFKYMVPSFVLLYEADEIFLDALNQWKIQGNWEYSLNQIVLNDIQNRS